MITLGSGGLVTAHTLIASLLLALNLFSGWNWRLKAFSIVVVACFYIIFYFSFPPILGWPSQDDVPHRFQIIGVYAQEPDNITGAKGDVFFWVVDRDAPAETVNTPRGYVLPFTPELHATAKQVGQKLKKNIPQIGEVAEEPDMGPHGVEKNDARSGQKSIKTHLQVMDMPTDLPPPKNPEQAPSSANP